MQTRCESRLSRRFSGRANKKARPGSLKPPAGLDGRPASLPSGFATGRLMSALRRKQCIASKRGRGCHRTWPYRLRPDRSGPVKLGEAARNFKSDFSMIGSRAIDRLALTGSTPRRAFRKPYAPIFGRPPAIRQTVTAGLAAPRPPVRPGVPRVGAPKCNRRLSPICARAYAPDFVATCSLVGLRPTNRRGSFRPGCGCNSA